MLLALGSAYVNTKNSARIKSSRDSVNSPRVEKEGRSLNPAPLGLCIKDFRSRIPNIIHAPTNKILYSLSYQNPKHIIISTQHTEKSKQIYCTERLQKESTNQFFCNRSTRKLSIKVFDPSFHGTAQHREGERWWLFWHLLLHRVSSVLPTLATKWNWRFARFMIPAVALNKQRRNKSTEKGSRGFFHASSCDGRLREEFSMWRIRRAG